MEVAGNGYINVRLDRGAYGRPRCTAGRSAPGRRPARRSSSSTPTSTRTRPRTSATCATPRWATRSCACCAPRGKQVEVQNYIDNTGVQVADVVVGFHYLEHKTPAEVRALIADPAVRFDYLCWDLYARTSRLLQGQPEVAGLARARRCTPSKPARASWPNWRTWWPTPSCRRT